MSSLREAARKIGIKNGPLSARVLTRAVGLAGPPLPPGVRPAGQIGPPPPVSLRQLMAILKVRLVEELKLPRQTIVTPAGTALGGFVDLTLRSDGSYKAHFHMRATGIPDYKFTVRAVFAASNGLAFALQHSGNVEGTESTGLFEGPRRDNDMVVQGSHPFIQDFWAEVKAGRLAVSKEYSTAGLTGFIQDIAKTVLSITSTVARGAGGAVIALGDEMVKAFNSLELGGDFGLVGGVVVFASGGGLVLAVTTGVQVGAMTKALIKYRPLEAVEWNFANQVYQEPGKPSSLPPRNKIFLTNLVGLGGRAFVMPGVGGNIYINIGAEAYDHPLTHQRSINDARGQLFIHELMHVWQIHHRSFVPGWVCLGLIVQVDNTFGNAYSYTSEGALPWSDFEIEQQASIVDDWFGGTRVRRQKPMDTADPYFRYIRDNVRPGRL